MQHAGTWSDLGRKCFGEGDFAFAAGALTRAVWTEAGRGDAELWVLLAKAHVLPVGGGVCFQLTPHSLQNRIVVSLFTLRAADIQEWLIF